MTEIAPSESDYMAFGRTYTVEEHHLATFILISLQMSISKIAIFNQFNVFLVIIFSLLFKPSMQQWPVWQSGNIRLTEDQLFLPL